MAESRRRRSLSGEEQRVWRLYTQSVMPLRPRPAEAERELPVVPAAPVPVAPAEPARGRSLPPPPAKSALPELAPGQAIGLDKARAERLRRGELPIEARLDLHGMTQDQAYHALARFLAASQAMQRRCVLVITGKGWRPGAGAEEAKGVLRSAVPRWLNEGSNRARILAFTPAKDRHGGGGALYVLIKKLR